MPIPGSTRPANCVAGRLVNLPTSVDLMYDPDRAANNLWLAQERSGGAPASTDLTDFSLSSIKQDDEGKQDALIVDGSVLGLPNLVTGSIHSPEPDTSDELSFDIHAEPSMGALDLTARNSTATDSLGLTVPDRLGLGTPSVYALMRGTQFVAHAAVTGLKHVGYFPVRDDADHPLETHVVQIDFDGPPRDMPRLRRHRAGRSG